MENELLGQCTYSLQDDKIRIYFFNRIDKEKFQEFKDLGFTWTMKQQSDLVAYWTPERQDFAEKYCGNLQDEESDMLDRSADRAERFSGYLENRINDVEKNTNHANYQSEVIGMQSQEKSECKARKIERLRNNADLNFSKATYWKSKINSVIGHAIFKESAELRKRRIRTLKKDCSKHQKDQDYFQAKILKYQEMDEIEFSNIKWKDESRKCSKIELIARLQKIFDTGHAARWLEHLKFRVEFEEKVLISQGVTKVDADYKKFGVINNKFEIVRVNKSKGIVNSLTVKNPNFNAESRWDHAESIILIENVTSYNPPDETIKREKKEVCSILNLSKNKIFEIFGNNVEIKEMTSEEYKKQGYYAIFDIKEGKFMSRYECKSKKIQGDFKIRGYKNYYTYQNGRKDIIVILTDKKFNDDKVKEYAKD